MHPNNPLKNITLESEPSILIDTINSMFIGPRYRINSQNLIDWLVHYQITSRPFINHLTNKCNVSPKTLLWCHYRALDKLEGIND